MKYWLGVLIGVALIVFGIVSYVRDRNFFDNAVSAKGVITAVWQKWDSDDDEYDYYARTRFKTEDGQSYEFEGGGSSSRAVGDEVQVFYDPANPYRARVGGRGGIWLMPLALVAMGLWVTGSGIRKSLDDRKTAKRLAGEQSPATANPGGAAAGSTETSVHHRD